VCFTQKLQFRSSFASFAPLFSVILTDFSVATVDPLVIGDDGVARGDLGKLSGETNQSSKPSGISKRNNEEISFLVVIAEGAFHLYAMFNFLFLAGVHGRRGRRGRHLPVGGRGMGPRRRREQGHDFRSDGGGGSDLRYIYGAAAAADPDL
jgi:hypothetical protein